MGVVQGKRNATPNFRLEADRVQASQKGDLIAALQTTVSNGASDTSITALVGGSDFFDPLDGGVANFIELNSSQELTMRIRTTGNAAVATADLKPIKIRRNITKTIDYIADITDIFFSNSSGSTANLDIVST